MLKLQQQNVSVDFERMTSKNGGDSSPKLNQTVITAQAITTMEHDENR